MRCTLFLLIYLSQTRRLKDIFSIYKLLQDHNRRSKINFLKLLQ